MINPNQFMTYVIRPVLEAMWMGGKDAELLVLETGMQESNLTHLDQLNSGSERPGPAYGMFQMERATHDDHWHNWLVYKPDVARVVRSYSLSRNRDVPDIEEMHGNLYYAVAMCRIHYRRVPAPLPKNREGRAEYWKAHYNTHLGSGKPKQFLARAKRLHRVYSA